MKICMVPHPLYLVLMKQGEAMTIDWYERRDELNPEQVFLTAHGVVKLDRSVPGDGTKWYVADWCNGWSYFDSTIEPGELIGEPIEDTPAAIEAALQAFQHPA